VREKALGERKKSLNLVYRFGEKKKKGDILVTGVHILLKKKGF
jgi:hypothetical protein